MDTGDRGQKRGHGGLFSADTSPEARAILVRRMREMTSREKTDQVWALTDLVRGSALAGLRMRHPEATEAETRWRFVALAYGREVARGMYGWDPDAEAHG